MNARVIKALILSVVLGWTMPVASQSEPVASQSEPVASQPEPVASQPEPVASQPDFLGSAVTTHPANFLNKFLWACTMLFNLGDSYTQIPLYGYSKDNMSEYYGEGHPRRRGRLDRLEEFYMEEFYMQALNEVARGNAHMAVVRQHFSQVITYSLYGVFVKTSKIEEIKSYLMGLDEDDLIAFTRPLKYDDYIPRIEGEFITSPSLWPDLDTITK